MKLFYKPFITMNQKIGFIFTLLIAFSFTIKAQCPTPQNNFQNFASYDLTPTGIGDTVTGYSTWGGDYHKIDVIAGERYEISTCKSGPFLPGSVPIGAASQPTPWPAGTPFAGQSGFDVGWDPQMTLVDAANSTVVLEHNDDFCGVFPQITYTAGFTGTVLFYLDSATVCDQFEVDSLIVYVAQIPSGPSLSLIANNISVNGANDGNIKATVSGGTAPYTYLWSNAATTDSIGGLSAGTYTVTVTDSDPGGAITVIDSATIIEPALVAEFPDSFAIQIRTNPAGLDTTVLPTPTGRYTSPTAVDLNGDGKMDFVTGVREGKLFYYENTGTVTDPFWQRTAHPTLDTIIINPVGVTNEMRPTFVDIDADGDMDLFLGRRYNYDGFKLDDVGFYRNIGSPTNAIFTEDQASIPGIQFQQLAEFASFGFGDMDNDGDLDMVVMGSDSAGYMENIGTATSPSFARKVGPQNPVEDFAAADALSCVPKVFDYDKDGDLDILYANDGGFVRVLVNSGTTSVMNFSGVTTGVDPMIDSLGTYDAGNFSVVDFADVTGDGLLDALFGSFLASPEGSSSRFSWMKGVQTGANVSIVSTNISCNGLSDGSATATASGTSPFFYQWSTGDTLTTSNSSTISSLAAGTYTVTVTEVGGVTATSMVTLTEPAALISASVVDSNVSCNSFTDGGATASATGGTMPYTYLWSNSATTASITGVAVGTYNVTITDANGCTSTSGVTITEPIALVAATVLDSNDAGGNTGGATASATGGTTPYSYSWSNAATTASITGVAAGTYTVTITDANGCTDSEPVTISAGPSVSITVDSNVTCNGLSNGGASTTVTGGTAPYTYLWSNSATTASITGVAAGTYSVTVTDANSLTATNSVTITEPAALVAASVVDSNATCNGFSDGGATASATGGTMPYTYLWSNSATTASITGIAAGTYNVTITDNNGCTSSSSSTITEPSTLVASVALDSNDVGNGGGATASATGGTMPYNYLWSNGATTASITGVAAGTYTTTITDNNGCTDTESVVISANPVPTVVIDSNVSCNGFSNGGATVNAVGGTMPYTYAWSNSATTASITGVAAGTYTVTVTDANGLTGTDSQTITEPALLVAASVVDSNVTCKNGVNGGATASATGGTAPYSYLWNNSATTASITGVAAGTYTVTVTDNNGCTSTSAVAITEPDSIRFNIIQLTDADCNGGNGSFQYVITGGTPDISGTDTTYGVSIAGSVSNRDSVSITAGLIEFLVTDVNGCLSDTVRFTINEPTAVVAAIAVDSNASCNGFTDGGATASATGGTGAYSYLWTNGVTAASNSGIAAGKYTVTVTDANGCDAPRSVTITEPTAITTITSVDSAASCANTNDGGFSVTVSGGTAPYTYLWSTSTSSATFATTSVTGVNPGKYYLAVTDANNCIKTDSVDVPALDVTAPTVVAQNLTVYLDANGSASITATDIDNNSTDNCGIATRILDSTNFDCSEVGANIVKLYVTDLSNNIDSATATVAVIDSIRPTVTTQAVTVYLDANGAASITTADVDNGSTDNCGTPSLALSNSTYSCSDVGANTVQLIATDVNGNIDSAAATITVVDTIKPTVVTQALTVYLDANGAASITTADVDNGTTDNCGTPTLALSNSAFSCSDVGANTVQLIATDVNGNIDSAAATITVVDTIKPTVVTQAVTVYLDANGAASITTADIDNNTTDNCGTPTLALSNSTYSCSDVGTNTVQLIATDVNGNVDSTSATVTVSDTIKPSVNAQNITVYLDGSGNVNITAADIDNGSADNCAVQSTSLDVTNFNCSNVGANTVQLRVTDINNNIDSASAIVTVLDTIKPTVVTQAVTVYLDASGSATVTTMDLNNGSSDNCTIQTMSLDIPSFTCSEVGANTVQLRVTDVNNNTDSASAIVTVLDTVSPTVITQNVTVYLNGGGVANITTTDIDNGSTDNCSIQSSTLDQTNFNCSDVGANTVSLTVTDVNSNASTATAVVTVLDTIKPVISGCPTNISQVIDAGNCTAVVTWTAPTAADNCTVDSLVASHNPGDVFALGTTTVTYIAYDPELNTDTCTFTVTITDSEDPVIANVPVNITTDNDAGICGAVVTWTAPTASDNCALDSLRTDVASGTTFQVGTTTVTYTAYDAAGNTSTASFTVTVNDTTKPVITCPSNIAQCDSIVTFADATATDNCGIATIVRTDVSGLNSGDEFPKGTTTLSYRVTDVNNNQATCDVDIRVFEPAKAIAGEDFVTRDIEPKVIEASSINAVQFNWTPFMSLVDATVEKPIANPQETTTYTMTVTSPDGCTDSDDMTITVNIVRNIDATTLFSPNGDGMNDTWTINKPALVQDCRLTIFNRNGTEVYSTTGYNNEWDGTINGEQLPEGTYYYIFDCPDDDDNLNGPITILRERR